MTASQRWRRAMLKNTTLKRWKNGSYRGLTFSKKRAVVVAEDGLNEH
ncbi:MAG: hypothetical protein QF704_14920 [Anaerolineales bacterium]|nr:hypothetical protein [Anaerolineales bacterium]